MMTKKIPVDLYFSDKFEIIKKIVDNQKKNIKNKEFEVVNCYTSVFCLWGIDWALKIFPYGNRTPYLSIYFGINSINDFDSRFSCKLDLKMTLINHKNVEKSVVFLDQEVSLSIDGDLDYGRREIISLEKLIDKKIGFINEDTDKLNINICVSLLDVKFIKYVSPLRKLIIECIKQNNINIKKIPPLLFAHKFNCLSSIEPVSRNYLKKKRNYLKKKRKYNIINK